MNFIELGVESRPPAPKWIVEMEYGSGAKMTIHLRGQTDNYPDTRGRCLGKGLFNQLPLNAVGKFPFVFVYAFYQKKPSW
jgi:hypothetical protein